MKKLSLEETIEIEKKKLDKKIQKIQEKEKLAEEKRIRREEIRREKEENRKFDEVNKEKKPKKKLPVKTIIVAAIIVLLLACLILSITTTVIFANKFKKMEKKYNALNETNETVLKIINTDDGTGDKLSTLDKELETIKSDIEALKVADDTISETVGGNTNSINSLNAKVKGYDDGKFGALSSWYNYNQKLSNQYTYFFYGKTYEELIDHMSSFVIPIIIPDILIDEGIRLDFDVNDEENKIDLVWDNIDDIILPTYKEVLNTINREDSKINCYNLFLKYLLLIRDGIQMNKIDDLDEVFDNERDIDNIKRIIKGEILFLNNKIKQLENAIEKNKKKTNNKNKSKQNEDL